MILHSPEPVEICERPKRLKRSICRPMIGPQPLRSLLSVFLLLLCALSALGDKRYYNTSGTLDWAMVEERRPYFAGGNWSPWLDRSITSTEGASFYSYTGFGNYSTGFNRWSCWPIVNPIRSDDRITLEYVGSDEISHHDTDSGEGTGAGTSSWPPFGINTNVWHRFALRCWRPADGTPQVGYVGQWIRDGASGTWYHKATFKTPFSVTGITGGLGGFFEQIGSSSFRAFHFRNAFAHQYGQPTTSIQRANQITIQYPGGYAGLIEGNTGALVWSDGGKTGLDPLGQRFTPNIPAGGLTLTITNQPVSPPFDPILVTNATASVLGSQLVVLWEMPDTSSPQLAYTIEVFNNSNFTGSPAVTIFDREPEARQKLLSIAGVATPYVRLTISDIFDNTNAPILITPTIATLSAATNEAGTVNGLSYKYYESGSGVVWSNIPDFSGLSPVLQGAVGDLDTTPHLRRTNYAFNYTGFINVPTDGIYAFTLTSFDGSKLIVDGVEVINYDGRHQRADKSGWIALAAGKHAVSVPYSFTDQRTSASYWDDVWVSYEGPGIARKIVPASAWFRVPVANEPVVSLVTPGGGTTVCGSNILLTAGVTLNGATVNRVQYYADEYPLGESTNTAAYPVNTFMGAAGTNWLRARLFYNTGYSVDSVPETLVSTTNMDLTPWELAGLSSYHNYATGAKVQDGAVTLTGDYLTLMTRRVTGDFTLIAHLADLTANVAAPDGLYPYGKWRAGIMVRENTDVTFGEPMGNMSRSQSTELFSTLDGGTYYEDATMLAANADANKWSANLGGGNRWYRIVRSGNTFYSSVSINGVSWSQVWSNTLSGIGTTPYVGPFIFAVQDSNPNRHWAKFDGISLVGSNVAGPPAATVSPTTAQACVGETVNFIAGVVGQTPCSYQWKFNGTNIVSATNSVLTLSNVQFSDAGLYTVSLTAGNGSATSSAASLTVNPSFTWDAQPSVAGVQDGSGNWGGSTTNWWDGTRNVAWQDNNAAVFGVNTTVNRTVTLINDVTPSSLIFNATGGGTYTLAGSSTLWAVDAPLPIAANADATISGMFSGSGGVLKTGSGTLTFSGTNSYAGTGPLIINSGALVLNTPNFNTYNGGGVFINNGSIFRITRTGGANRYDFSSRTFTFDENGGGTFDTSTSVNCVFGNNTLKTLGGAPCQLTGASGLNINGTTTFNITRGTGSSDFIAAARLWNAGSIAKTGGGILELSTTNTYVGTTTVNEGTLRVNGNIATGAVNVNAGATLGGTGFIGGATTVNAGGTLSPGTTGIGTLTLTNTLMLRGTTLMEINKTAAIADKVEGVSTLLFGGTLAVSNLAGTLAAGDSFMLFGATSYLGAFATINLPVLLPGLQWDASQLGVNGSIRVVPVTYTLTYAAAANGSISGTTPQTVNHGASGAAVTAAPNGGYAFGSWSDGKTTNPRTDMNVTNDIAVTANFVSITPPVIVAGSGNLSAGNFTFQFTGVTGQHYRIEHTPVLPSPGSWQTVTDIVSLAASPCSVIFAATNAAAFFRVRLIY